MKKPVRLNKKEEKKSFLRNKTIYGIPIEFIGITVIGLLMLLIIFIFVSSCTESGLIYNKPMY